MNELKLNSPEVKQAIKEHGLKPGENGQPAVEPGSRQKLPKPAEQVSPSAPVKKKKVSVELSVEQEARMLREAAQRNVEPKAYIQSIIDEALGKGIGRSFISAPRLNGNAPSKKVTAPTNDFGRGY